MRLISDWRQTWRYYSTQAMAAAAAVQVTWSQLPDDLKAAIPAQWVSYGTTALMILGVLGRLIDQGEAKE